MKLIELMKSRRSCRKYSDKVVERQTIERIIEGTLTAPSSKNMRTSRFVVVTNRETIAALAAVRASGASAFVADAPVAIIVMSDTSLGGLDIENSSISATFMQLLAHEQGLGSCWVQIEGRLHDEEQPQGETAQQYVQRVVPQTAGHRIECIISIGYPSQEPKAHKEQDDSDKVIWVE